MGLREKGHGTSLPLGCLDDPESSLKRFFWMLSLLARPASVPGLLGLTVPADFISFPFLANQMPGMDRAVPALLLWLEGKTWGYFRIGNDICFASQGLS